MKFDHSHRRNTALDNISSFVFVMAFDVVDIWRKRDCWRICLVWLSRGSTDSVHGCRRWGRQIHYTLGRISRCRWMTNFDRGLRSLWRRRMTRHDSRHSRWGRGRSRQSFVGSKTVILTNSRHYARPSPPESQKTAVPGRLTSVSTTSWRLWTPRDSPLM